MENLSSDQNAVISSISNYGKQQHYGANTIRIVRDEAYIESSLGRVSLPGKIGLFQYDQKTWDQVYPGKDINDQNDQIAAFFSEVSYYGNIFGASVRSGNTLFSNYTSADYIDAVHHFFLGNPNYNMTKDKLDNGHQRMSKAATALGTFRITSELPNYRDPDGSGTMAYSPSLNFGWQNFDVNLPHGIVTVSEDYNIDSFGTIWKVP